MQIFKILFLFCYKAKSSINCGSRDFIGLYPPSIGQLNKSIYVIKIFCFITKIIRRYLSDEAAINLNNYGQNRLSAYQSADDFIMFTNPKSMNFKSTIKINSLFTTQYFRFLNIGHNGCSYAQ